MSFIKKIELDYNELCSLVGDMIGDDSPKKIQDLLSYLHEEISYARHQWEISIKNEDWKMASKILHREKLFLSALDPFNNPEIIHQLNDVSVLYNTHQLNQLYTELVDLFKKLENIIGQSHRNSPS